MSSLNERYETVHKHEISNWKTEIALLDRKSEEYRNRVTKLEVLTLLSIDLSPPWPTILQFIQEEYAEQKLDDNGLIFSKLKEFQQEVEDSEKTLVAKQQELSQFLDLPLVIS